MGGTGSEVSWKHVDGLWKLYRVDVEGGTVGNLRMVNRQKGIAQFTPVDKDADMSAYMKSITLYAWLYPRLPQREFVIRVNSMWMTRTGRWHLRLALVGYRVSG